MKISEISLGGSFWHPKWFPESFWCKLKWKYDPHNRLKTHESDFQETVRRLGGIKQRIFSAAQSGGSIQRAVWNWSSKSLPPCRGSLLFCRFFSRSFEFSTPPITAPGSPRMRSNLRGQACRGPSVLVEQPKLRNRAANFEVVELLFVALVINQR